MTAATVVLVHGAWHGGWCWERVQPHLEAAGVPSVAVDLPGHGASPDAFTDLHGDADSVTAVIDGAGRPVVLVGHSYGGAVITEAGVHPAVARLVYLSAFNLAEGEACASAAPDAAAPATDLGSLLVLSADGSTCTIDAAAAADTLYGDCSPADAAWAMERLGPQPIASFRQAPAAIAWRDRPSTYVVCTEDRAVHPSLQRVLASRATDTVDWPTSHSPFLSQPERVATFLTALTRRSHAVKVRIGYGLGVRSLTNDGDRFGAFVDALERLRFDSLWLSERITGDCPDPVVALAFAAARTAKLKLGTGVQVLPGRNPLLVAKEWATLDRLSNGRTLPAFGLGVVDPREQQAFGVARADRAPWFDEALPLLRRFWTEDSVDHDGPRFHFEGASVLPKPVQQPPDVWLGGIAPSELRRAGRLGDGWLPSFCTPDDVRAGRSVIEETAAAHDRAIDPEHFGALVAYASGPLPDMVAAAIRRRRPDLDPGALVPDSLAALRDRLEGFIDAGASKFVVIPLTEPDDWDAELDAVASALKPLET